MTKRELILAEAIKAWVDGNYMGTIILGTGMGKTYIAAKVACRMLEKGIINSVAVVVPTLALMDNPWRKQVRNLGYNEDDLHYITTKSAYVSDLTVDLLIVDEVHTALSPEYRKLFEKIKYKKLLCLTATLPEDKEYVDVLESYAPVVYTKHITEVEGDGIVSDYTIMNVPIKMNRKDQAKYNLFNGMFAEAQLEVGFEKIHRDELKDLSIFEIAQEYSRKKEFETEEDRRLSKYAKAYWSAMTMRKWACYNSTSKMAAVKEIISKISGDKWIIFNKTIKFAEDLKKVLGKDAKVYHSKLKKEEREEVLQQFEQGTFKYLIAVDALNAGLDMPEIDNAICASGVSTELTAVQQLGRICRFRDNKKALFINLFSPGTIEEHWIRKKLKSFKNNVFWVESTKHMLDVWTHRKGDSIPTSSH